MVNSLEDAIRETISSVLKVLNNYNDNPKRKASYEKIEYLKTKYSSSGIEVELLENLKNPTMETLLKITSQNGARDYVIRLANTGNLNTEIEKLITKYKNENSISLNKAPVSPASNDFELDELKDSLPKFSVNTLMNIYEGRGSFTINGKELNRRSLINLIDKLKGPLQSQIDIRRKGAGDISQPNQPVTIEETLSDLIDFFKNYNRELFKLTENNLNRVLKNLNSTEERVYYLKNQLPTDFNHQAEQGVIIKNLLETSFDIKKFSDDSNYRYGQYSHYGKIVSIPEPVRELIEKNQKIYDKLSDIFMQLGDNDIKGMEMHIINLSQEEIDTLCEIYVGMHEDEMNESMLNYIKTKRANSEKDIIYHSKLLRTNHENLYFCNHKPNSKSYSTGNKHY